MMRFGAVYAQTGEIEIGKNVSMNCNVTVDACNSGIIRIGDDCLIGPNVVLRAADHCFGRVDIPIRMQGHRSGEILVENDVWLGANVVVTAGGRIGKGSVVGAGSIVTGNIPPYSVAVGAPARVIRTRVLGDTVGM